jgi:hypothetical protein
MTTHGDPSCGAGDLDPDDHRRSCDLRNSAVKQIDQTTQMNAGVVAESTNASMALAEERQQLATQVGAFRLRSRGPQAQREPATKNVAGKGDVKDLPNQLRDAYPTTARVA